MCVDQVQEVSDRDNRGRADVQGGDIQDRRVGGDPLTKLQPHRLPEAFVRIGLVRKESHPPVTAVGIWGPEGNAGIGQVTDEVGPKKLKTGACQQPSSLVGPTMGEGGGGDREGA